jgi:molybdate transport system permease protein
MSVGGAWDPLLLSLEVASIGTVVGSMAGVGLGAVLASKRFFGRDLLDALVSAPMVLPPTVLGYWLLTVLGRRSAIGRAFESIFGSPIVFTPGAAVIAAALAALPFVVKASRAAIEEVDARYVAAAATLGATPARVFFSIVLPLASRGILAGIAVGFARALGDFGVTLMIAGNLEGQTRTASLAIYDAVLADENSRAAGLAATLAAVAIGALYAVNKLSARARRA